MTDKWYSILENSYSKLMKGYFSEKKVELATILANNLSEEEVQRFLNKNRFLLVAGLTGIVPSILYSRFESFNFFVIPKLRLGSEYVVDFAVGRMTQMGYWWTLVELERPGYKLFTLKGNPTRELTHAIRQVQEWQRWINTNPQYTAEVFYSALEKILRAPSVESDMSRVPEMVRNDVGYRGKSLIANIHRPRMTICKVIIGRKDSLTRKTENLLEQMNIDYHNVIEIMTYDRLLILEE